MAWIESHQELMRHPKTKRCARMLKVSIPTMIGHLHLLWYWCMDFAEDGNLTNIENYVIAEEMMWEGDPDELIKALMECGGIGKHGFIESTDNGEKVIHEWHDYAGKLIERREQDAIRKRNIRSKRPVLKDTECPTMPDGDLNNVDRDVPVGDNTDYSNVLDGNHEVKKDVRRMSDGCPTDVHEMSHVTVPYRTVPNLTVQNQKDSPLPLSSFGVGGISENEETENCDFEGDCLSKISTEEQIEPEQVEPEHEIAVKPPRIGRVSKARPSSQPPTLDEITRYMTEYRDSETAVRHAEDCYLHYKKLNWKQNNGVKIGDWVATAQVWIRREEKWATDRGIQRRGYGPLDRSSPFGGERTPSRGSMKDLQREEAERLVRLKLMPEEELANAI